MSGCAHGFVTAVGCQPPLKTFREEFLASLACWVREYWSDMLPEVRGAGTF